MLHELRRVSRPTLASLALALCLGGAAGAAPPAPAGVPVAAPAPRALPDYGGRGVSLGSALDGAGAAAPLNPLAQAGRAFEALVIVLVVVVGGLLLLKRSGLLVAGGTGTAPWAARLLKRSPGGPSVPGGDAPAEMLLLLGSQTLPHSPGAGLHLVSVGGRVLLLGATGQSVTLLTEVADLAEGPPAETPEEHAAFADYLARVGVAGPGEAGAGATRASLSAATDRLQSLLSRGPQ